MPNIGLSTQEIVKSILVFITHGYCSDLIGRLSKMIKESQYKTVCNRYKSSFDVDAYV